MFCFLSLSTLSRLPRFTHFPCEWPPVCELQGAGETIVLGEQLLSWTGVARLRGFAISGEWSCGLSMWAKHADLPVVEYAHYIPL